MGSDKLKITFLNISSKNTLINNLILLRKESTITIQILRLIVNIKMISNFNNSNNQIKTISNLITRIIKDSITQTILPTLRILTTTNLNS